MVLKVKSAKKVLSVALAAAVIGTYVVPYNTTEVDAASKVRLNKTKVTLYDGASYRLKVSGTKSRVKWKSFSPSRVAVSQRGTLVAKRPGKAVVKAYVGKKSYRCAVTVRTPKLSRSSVSIKKGKTYGLKMYYTKRAVKWSSTNKSVATVSSRGTILGRNKGTCTIYAVSGSVRKAARVTVTDPTVYATGVKISGIKVSDIEIGNSVKLKATISPSNVTNKKVTWKSDNTSIASVSSTGVLKFLKAGSTKIRCTTGDKRATSILSITIPEKDTKVYATDINLSGFPSSFKVGDTFKLTAIVMPLNVTDDSVSWKSSDESVATVSSVGMVTLKKEGSVTITVKSGDGRVSKTASFTVVKDGGEDNNVYATDIDVAGLPDFFEVGDTFKLTGTVVPSNATNKNVSWSSSDESVATITSNGDVELKKAGTVTFSVKSGDNVVTKQLTVTVTEKDTTVYATDVEVAGMPNNFNVGDTFKLTGTVKPDNATNKDVTWKSSDESIATVDAEGNVELKAEGEVKITVTSGDKIASRQFTITVLPKGSQDDTVYATDIEVAGMPSKFNVGDTFKLVGTVVPANAKDTSVTWKSSDEVVATIDSNGNVELLKEGSVTFTVTSGDTRVSRQYTVEVTKDAVTATDIDISGLPISYFVGDTFTLTGRVVPETATNKNVTWESSDRSVATVTNSGVVDLVSAGTVDIRAISGDGAVTKTITLTVVEKPENPVLATDITVSGMPDKFETGDEFKLVGTVSPVDATNKNVTWSSSNEEVATVDSNGNVRLVKPGEVNIIATSGDKAVTKTVTITVVERQSGGDTVYAEDVEITGVPDTVKVGDTFKLTAKVTPANASDKTVKWSSDNEDVATVDSEGNVTVKGIGVVGISAQSGDKMVTKKVTITVNDNQQGGDTVYAEDITITGVPDTFKIGDTFKLTGTISPSNVTDKTVTWSSNNTDVATIDQSGNVTIKGTGTVRFTAVSGDQRVTKSIEVTLGDVDDTVYANDIELGTLPEYFFVGNTFKIDATVKPDDAKDKTVTWTSSDTSIATVDNSGNVELKKEGKVTLTVKSGDERVSKEISFTVADGSLDPGDKPVTGMTLTQSGTDADLVIGGSVTLTPEFTPADATNKTVIWESSDDSVATVNNGVVNFLKAGVVEISCTNPASGFIAKVKYTIQDAEEPKEYQLSVGGIPQSLEIGQSAQLEVTVTENGTTVSKGITYSSADPDKLAVDSNGLLTAKAKGYVAITCKVDGMDLSKTFSVNVTDVTVKRVEISGLTETGLYAGEDMQLSAVVTPANAANKDVTWTSSNEEVATVTSNGLVHFIKAGEVTITCTSVEDTSIKCNLDCKVVERKVQHIDLEEPDTTKLQVGNSFKLGATVTPENAFNKAVTWESSDETKASVSEDGTITLVGATADDAMVTITCRAADGGGAYATVSFPVLAAPDESNEGDPFAETNN